MIADPKRGQRDKDQDEKKDEDTGGTYEPGEKQGGDEDTGEEEQKEGA